MGKGPKGASTHGVCLFGSWHGSCEKWNKGKSKTLTIIRVSKGLDEVRVDEPCITKYPMPITLRWMWSFVSNVHGKASK